MKVGDLIKTTTGPVRMRGLIVAIGYSQEYKCSSQSPSLHPDVWVISSHNGQKERWSSYYVEVISESR